jgi:hypothetical protein
MNVTRLRFVVAGAGWSVMVAPLMRERARRFY